MQVLPRRRAAPRPLVVAALLAGVLLFVGRARGWERLEDQSFKAPFNDFTSAGARDIGVYRSTGSTKVNEHFIRLTPDRQSKRGTLWSGSKVGVEDWSVVIEFRVSGQGRTLFGDGLAFWFTDMPVMRSGDLFGVTENFKGFSVIFDTFRNSEHAAVHKDISVLTGDGSPGAADRRNTDRPGCDADFRYYEGADNFDVARSTSYVKITLKNRKLSVKIDQRASGSFMACFEANDVLPADFDITQGYFGVSGTTGQLADNHDILSLQAFKLLAADDEAPNPELHHSKAEDETLPAHETVGNPNYDPEAALRSIINKEKARTKKLVDDVEHSVEFSLSAVRDELKKLIGKVEKKVGEEDERLKVLENKLKDQLTSTLAGQLQEKVRELEAALTNNVEERLARLEAKNNMKSETIRETIKAEAKAHAEKVKTEMHKKIIENAGSSTWVWAFLLLVVGVVLALAYMYKKVRSVASSGSLPFKSRYD